jgi:hypothetical protein
VRDQIYNLAVDILGPTPLERIGRPPKVLLAYQVEEAHDKITTEEYFFGEDLDNKDIKGKVEILARGQQFVSDGEHPETRAPYRWPKKSPLDVPAHEFPVVTYEALQEFRDRAAQLLRDAGARTRAQILADIANRERIGAEAAGLRDNEPPSYEKVASALDAIPNTLDREGYIRIGYAVHDALGEGGRDLFMGWAKQHASFDENNAASDWKSFQKRRSITCATLFFEAQARGWRSPDARKRSSGSTHGARPIPEEPLPLMRPLPPAEPYPIDALPPSLRAPAIALHNRIEAPMAICAQSVLATVSLVVQGYANVWLPVVEGQSKPISSFFLTIGESGERKTTVDMEAAKAVRRREKELREEYLILKRQYQNQKDVWDKNRDRIIKAGNETNQVETLAALEGLGAEPQPPLSPQLTCQEPTIEALIKTLIGGQPSMGIYSDEGASLIGGPGMREDDRIKFGAHLSKLWDGNPITRDRAGDGSSFVEGRRLSLHLMVQPGVAQELLSDRKLLDQGLLSRFLICQPKSTAGTRFGREPNPADADALKVFEKRCLDILRRPMPLAVGKRNELEPPNIQFSPEARALWDAFRRAVEPELKEDGEYEPIRGLANKMAEHAARLAAAMTLFENITATDIPGELMVGGIKLAQFYASEALRLFEAGHINPDLLLAQKLLDWLQRDGAPEVVSLRDIYSDGPNPIRGVEKAEKIIRILINHGWIKEEKTTSKDKRREIVRYHVVRSVGDEV